MNNEQAAPDRHATLKDKLEYWRWVIEDHDTLCRGQQACCGIDLVAKEAVAALKQFAHQPKAAP